MALHYDLRAIKDREKNYPPRVGDDGKEYMNGITHTMTFISMSVGLGEINEANLDEWKFRIAALQRVYGPWMQGVKNDGETVEMYITAEHIEGHLGMKVNVADEDRRWFRDYLWRAIKSEAGRWANDQLDHNEG